MSALPADLETTVGRSPRQTWRAARRPVLLAVGVLVAAVLLAISNASTPAEHLDPRAAHAGGSRAVAEVLRDQGVNVTLVRRSAQLRSATQLRDTILITHPGRLVDSQIKALLAAGTDVVVVAAQNANAFLPGAEAVGPAPDEVLASRCLLDVAVRAGESDAGQVAYDVDKDKLRRVYADAQVERCYPIDGEPTLVQVREGGRTITLMGNPAALTNDRFDDEGNAALALGLLGARPTLLWYIPSLDDVPAGQARSVEDMIPTAVWWAVAQAAIAIALLALWRARRLGPIVAEPLPVIIRASETVEGRARLYRRARARDKAAEALRGGARRRLLLMLGLPRSAAPATVVDAVAARSRRTAPDVAALLYGAAPADDAALVRLADDIDALEREVFRP